MIKAAVALPSIVRSSVSLDAITEAVTVEITRDLLLVQVPAALEPASFPRGLALIVDVRLPASGGRPPRYLECVTTVRSTEPLGDVVQVLLDVASMNFIPARTAPLRTVAAVWASRTQASGAHRVLALRRCSSRGGLVNEAQERDDSGSR